MKFLLSLFALLLLIGCSNEVTNNIQPAKSPYAVIKGASGLEYHTGLLHNEEELRLKGLGDSHARLLDCENLPAEFDLRKLGLVPPVRNQGGCGSCWSFSKTGSLESALLGQGISVDLSEQELVSCDKSQYGCGGGLLTGFKYQIGTGQGLESDFPYRASDVSCKQTSKAAKGVSFQYVGTASRGPTEKELKCALYNYKTIPWITVSASNAWGSPPSSERTAYSRCGRGQTNHAVGVVGWWTDANGKAQFIMKNSWGTSWGDKGYMSLPLGCDSFGEEVAFIEVEKSPTPPKPPEPPTPPGPCVSPKAKLSAEVQIFAGVETMLGVKPEAGVTYSWENEGKVVGNEAMLYVVPPKDTVYKLTAKNSCAVVESQVRVRIVMSAK